MFEKNEENDAAVKRGIDLSLSVERGTKIPLAQFESAFGCERSTHKFRSLVSQLKKEMLREHGIVLRSRQNHTITPLTEEEQVDWFPASQSKKRWRSTTRSKKALEAVSPESLPMHLRRLRVVSLDEIRLERKQLRRCQNAIRKTEVNPIRKIPHAAEIA